jgi:hypothetical protein
MNENFCSCVFLCDCIQTLLDSVLLIRATKLKKINKGRLHPKAKQIILVQELVHGIHNSENVYTLKIHVRKLPQKSVFACLHRVLECVLDSYSRNEYRK